MNKIYIGVSGKMGTGKSTVSNAIIAHLGGTRIPLAAPLYALQDTIYTQCSIELQGDKDRDLLIALGLWGRSKSETFWLDQFIKTAEASKHDIVICDDVRFPNEADFFSKHGLLIRLEGMQRGANVDHNTGNKTEIALDDYVFENTISNLNGITDTVSNVLDIIGRYYGQVKDSKGL